MERFEKQLRLIIIFASYNYFRNISFSILLCKCYNKHAKNDSATQNVKNKDMLYKAIGNLSHDFAAFGDLAKNKGRSVDANWHDAIRRRKDEDVTSKYMKSVRYMRDKKENTLWGEIYSQIF